MKPHPIGLYLLCLTLTTFCGAQNGYEYNRPNGKPSLQSPNNQAQNGYQKPNDYENQSFSNGYQYNRPSSEFQTTTSPVSQTVGFPQPFKSNSGTTAHGLFPFSFTETTTLATNFGSNLNSQTTSTSFNTGQSFMGYPSGPTGFNGGNLGSQNPNSFSVGSGDSQRPSTSFGANSGFEGSNNFNSGNGGNLGPSNVFGGNSGSQGSNNFNTGRIGNLGPSTSFGGNSGSQGPSSFNTGRTGNLGPSTSFSGSSGSQNPSSFNTGNAENLRQSSSFGDESQKFGDNNASNGGDLSAIPGSPNIDYPILSEIPKTSFNCNAQKFPGYYTDIETRCQVFHICANDLKYDFICPNGTIFHQKYFVCVWWNQFDCNTAESLYYLNENIYDYSKVGGSSSGISFSNLSGPQGTMSNFAGLMGSQGSSTVSGDSSGLQGPSADFGSSTGPQGPSANFGPISGSQGPSVNFASLNEPQRSSSNTGQPSRHQIQSASFGLENGVQRPSTNYGPPLRSQNPSANFGSPSGSQGSIANFGSSSPPQMTSASFGPLTGSQGTSSVNAAPSVFQKPMTSFNGSKKPSASYGPPSKPQGLGPAFGSSSGGPQRPSTSYIPPNRPQTPANYPRPDNNRPEINNQGSFQLFPTTGMTSGENFSTSFSQATTIQPEPYNTETNVPANTYGIPESSYSSYQTESPVNNNSPFSSNQVTKPNREYLPPYRK